MQKKIETIEDIKLLVDNFYGKIRQDDLLSHIFNSVIQDRWPVHLEKMYRFWQTVLLEDHTYYGAPFTPHAHLPVKKDHFERWIQLFHGTLDEHFTGEVAEDARWRSSKMAEMFLYKIEYYREMESKPLI